MNAAKKRQNLSNIDTAWWRMEHPTNLMMVTGFLAFEQPIEMDQLTKLVKHRLLDFARFRQRVVDTRPNLRLPRWEEVEPDLTYHLAHERLADPGGYEALRLRAAELMSTPLDYERPLWQIHLLDNFERGNAIIVRTHHCMADGMALIAVMFSLTGKSAEASLRLEEPFLEEPERLSSSGLFRVANALKTGLDTLTSPSKMLDLAKLGGATTMTTMRLLMKKPDPPTPFKGALGTAKIPAWSRSVPLAQVKAIKNVVKATVNDVLLTAMTGGLRRYLLEKEWDVTDLNFRAAVPVNLRPPGRGRDLGNYFGLVFLSLPVGIADPLERLFKLKKRMDRIKNSPEAVVAIGILKAVGMSPAEIQRVIVNIFGAKSTAIMTNVPGPRNHLYMAGCKIVNQMFWVPMSGRVGLGVSIISYADEVRLGVATDAALIPDPDRIIEGFYAELEDMMVLVDQVRNQPESD